MTTCTSCCSWCLMATTLFDLLPHIGMFDFNHVTKSHLKGIFYKCRENWDAIIFEVEVGLWQHSKKGHNFKWMFGRWKVSYSKVISKYMKWMKYHKLHDHASIVEDGNLQLLFLLQFMMLGMHHLEPISMKMHNI
jgi:hypothetical protein